MDIFIELDRLMLLMQCNVFTRPDSINDNESVKTVQVRCQLHSGLTFQKKIVYLLYLHGSRFGCLVQTQYLHNQNRTAATELKKSTSLPELMEINY